MEPLSGAATAALVIFGLTYVVLGFGAIPPLRVDRTGAALIGASAMIGFGVLTAHEAVSAVDFHTIALLFGMMVVVAHLRIAGFFEWLGAWAMERAGSPRGLLVLLLWLSGVTSALFVNDTACILLTPLALESARAVKRHPLPYLLAIAMGANLGSVATIVGNPQNMLVASFSKISYARFATVLTPVAVASLAVGSLFLVWHFRKVLAGPDVLVAAGSGATAVAAGTLGTALPTPPSLDRPLLWKSAIVSAALLVALLAGVMPSLAALLAASALLISRRVDPQEIYRQINWSLLTMFAGLFVVVAGVEQAGLTERALELLGPNAGHSFPAFLGAIVMLGNLVSNVPAVLLLKSWAAHSFTPERAWLALAMASTLAGNLTLVGSVANLIVVEQARGEAKVGFWAYAKAGVPLTLATLAIGVGWLLLVTPGR